MYQDVLNYQLLSNFVNINKSYVILKIGIELQYDYQYISCLIDSILKAKKKCIQMESFVKFLCNVPDLEGPQGFNGPSQKSLYLASMPIG